VMNGTFWVGIYPGLNHEQLDFIVSSIQEVAQKQYA